MAPKVDTINMFIYPSIGEPKRQYILLKATLKATFDIHDA